MLPFFFQYGFVFALSFFLAGALGSLLLNNRFQGRLANGFTYASSMTACAFAIGFAVAVLISKQAFLTNIPLPFSFLPAYFPLRFDGFSALFILLIATIGFLASLYGIGYQKQFIGKYNLGLFGFFYNVFLASLLLVVTANHGIYFLIAWEIMSLSSYFLVIFEHRHKENIKAGFLYFVMSQIGTAFILLSILFIYKTLGSVNFDYVRANFSLIPNLQKNLILLFALIGFGTKAGIIPLHIWLPEAHPAAPSHVSALMSGVLIKTAIFMIIRFFLDFFPFISIQWGLLILALGAISSLLGVLYALSEHDLKRLLAYHSVENIGIILLGIGSTITFMSLKMYPLAVLGLSAALFHTINHAVFKSLLFMGAGSVISKTHTRNMEEFGGLLKKMPYTGLFFLVGAAAISALPPLNGFASEWLTFQALFSGIVALALETKVIFIFAIVALAFTGGLAAACFVKAFGVTFLARPRSAESEKATESGMTMRFAMGALAVLCIVLGVGASFLLPILSTISQHVLGIAEPALQNITLSLPALPSIALGIVLLFFATAAVIQLLTRKQRTVVSETWSCGSELTPRMEITGTSFSRSLMTIFKGILKPTKQTDTEYHDEESRYFAKSTTVTLNVPNMYKQYLYDPVARAILKVSQFAKKIQGGNINAYLLYIFLTLIALLIFAIR